MFDSSGYLIFLISYFLNTAAGVPVDGSTDSIVYTVDGKPKIRYYFSKEEADVTEAAEKCKNMKMELVKIFTAEQQQEIGEELIKKNLKGKTYWTAGYRKSILKAWMWSSNEPIKQFFWNRGEPNYANKNELCIETFVNEHKKNLWNDAPCFDARRFICYSTKFLDAEVATEGNAGRNDIAEVNGNVAPANGSADVEVTASGKIPKNYYFSDKVANFTDAAEKCENLNMELVNILTAEQQQEIGEQLIKQNLTAHYWIGGYRESLSKPWMWVSNEPITKFFWNRGEPNNAKKNEYCIETFVNKNKKNVWNDTPCSTKRRYICDPTKCLNGGVAIEGNADLNATANADGSVGVRSGCNPINLKVERNNNQTDVTTELK